MKPFQRFSLSRKRDDPPSDKKQDTASPDAAASVPPSANGAKPTPTTKSDVDPKDIPLPPDPLEASAPPAQTTSTDKPGRSNVHGRSFSLRALLSTQRSDERKQQQQSPSPSAPKPDKPEEKIDDPPAVTVTPPKPLKGSEKRAHQSALVMQSLIVGPSPEPTKPVGPAQLNKVKALLIQPKSAKQIIAALRLLPGIPGTDAAGASTRPRGPIHAVCLPYTEQEAHNLHFAKLAQPAPPSEAATPATAPDTTAGAPAPFPSVTTASVETLSSMLKDMKVVNLLSTTNLGIGQPGDGSGILSGAVPTAETVMRGMTQITPELMALGFATGKILVPNHEGVYPPTDRMSVLTYWWGLELLLPPPTLAYLGSAESITNAVINFLTALSLINNGVREVLPFIRYIGQFVEFEFDAIKAQNKGKGVVCAATWILPAAMVPRPWDFPSRPTPKTPAVVTRPVAPTIEAGSPPPVVPQVVVTAPS